MLTTPLHDAHRALGARMAPFGGFEMPIQYEGILAEHRWCRSRAALFDICHMGELLFRGDVSASGLDRVFTVPVSTIPVGRARYGLLLNERGGIVDDLIIFRLAHEEVMIVTNAARTAVDFQTIAGRLTGGDFTDISPLTAKLDLQGPESRGVMVDLVDPGVAPLTYFRSMRTSIAEMDAIVSRTGYTGELGYEIFLPAEGVCRLWERLLQDPRVKPAGLGARDLLRLEMGYPLYGHELDEGITPLEAGLDPFVDFSSDFVGKGALVALRERGIPRRRIAFRVEGRRSPRHGYRIVREGVESGTVSSGGFSPMLGCGIGIGMVAAPPPAPGERLEIGDGRVTMEGIVTTLPFYRGGSLRS